VSVLGVLHASLWFPLLCLWPPPACLMCGRAGTRQRDNAVVCVCTCCCCCRGCSCQQCLGLVTMHRGAGRLTAVAHDHTQHKLFRPSHLCARNATAVAAAARGAGAAAAARPCGSCAAFVHKCPAPCSLAAVSCGLCLAAVLAGRS
jgi:hypothetical protein